MKLTVGRRITLGFVCVLALFGGSTLLAFRLLGGLEKDQTRVVDVRYPTAMTSTELLGAVDASLVAMRGYLLLGADAARADAIKKDRLAAWAVVSEKLEALRTLSASWTVKENVERLRSAEAALAGLRQAQDEIEGIAHTPANIPSYEVLLTQAAPRASKIVEAITGMIDEEAKLEASAERKALLGALADSRGSFALGLAGIRAYLLSGDARFKDDFDARWAANEAALTRLTAAAALFTPTQRERWETYQTLRGEFAPLPSQMFQLRGTPDWNRATAWLGTKAAPRVAEVRSALTAMIESQRQLVANDRERLAATKNSMRLIMSVSSAIAFALGLLIAALLSRQIVRAIRPLVVRAGQIAEGDLSGDALPVRTRDEIGELVASVNAMSGSLRSVVRELSDSSVELAGAATEIAASSEQMARGLDEQSGQIMQISAATQEMSASVTEVATKSAQAAATANQSGECAEAGGGAVAKTIDDMRAIEADVSAATAGVTQLSGRSEEIGRVIGVINDIADQTNLLALNAAIEAARAGEHGRGFAVVADEVRKLAERTTRSTEEVAGSIRAIQTDTSAVVERMAVGKAQVQASVERAAGAGQSLGLIVTGARNVAGMVADIAAAAEQQAAASEQISRTIESITAASKQASQGAGQSAAAAGQLSGKAERLRALASRFRLTAGPQQDLAGAVGPGTIGKRRAA